MTLPQVYRLVKGWRKLTAQRKQLESGSSGEEAMGPEEFYKHYKRTGGRPV